MSNVIQFPGTYQPKKTEVIEKFHTQVIEKAIDSNDDIVTTNFNVLKKELRQTAFESYMKNSKTVKANFEINWAFRKKNLSQKTINRWVRFYLKHSYLAKFECFNIETGEYVKNRTLAAETILIHPTSLIKCILSDLNKMIKNIF